MFQEAFTKLEDDEIADVLDRINPVLEGTRFDSGKSSAMALALDFYPGYRLLNISDYSVMPPNERAAVVGEKTLFILDYTNAPIYAFNESLPIKLSKKNVVSYIQFFFMYVRGRHGCFFLCENIDDIPWKDEPPPAARKAIGKMITPIEIESKEKDGSFHVRGCMAFKNSLFKSKIIVSKTGIVKIEDEELLIEDMPLLDTALAQ